MIHQRKERCITGIGGSCVYRFGLDVHVAFVFAGFLMYFYVQIKQPLQIRKTYTWECFSGIDRTRRGLVELILTVLTGRRSKGTWVRLDCEVYC